MLDENPIEGTDDASALELDAPAAESPPALLAKAGALSGALVQRGRERAPRLVEASVPTERLAPPAAPTRPDAPSAALAAVSPGTAPEAGEPATEAAPRSRWSDALFAIACGVAFFATFLFVLRF